jgi:hypothetical protein
MRGVLLLVLVGVIFLLGVRVGYALRGRSLSRSLASRKREE